MASTTLGDESTASGQILVAADMLAHFLKAERTSIAVAL
jgi:hypothetical protein